VRFHPLEPGEKSVDQSGDDVGTERKPRRMIPAVLAFDPCTFQKRRVRQDIGRGTELVEQLLGRVQCAVPGYRWREQLVCLPNSRRARAFLCARLQPTGTGLDVRTANLRP
jgi:hypothetical protein